VRGNPLAAQDHVERTFGGDQPWQPLGSTRAGDEAELDLGQAETRIRGGDPVVRGKRQLEPSAETDPCDSSDDRLRAGLHLLDHVPQRGRGPARRRAELADVRAGGKEPPGSVQYDRAHGRVVQGFLQGLDDAGPQRLREPVDGRVPESDDRDAAVDSIVDLSHGRSGTI
jgi:hypothetical protein